MKTILIRAQQFLRGTQDDVLGWCLRSACPRYDRVYRFILNVGTNRNSLRCPRVEEEYLSERNYTIDVRDIIGNFRFGSFDILRSIEFWLIFGRTFCHFCATEPSCVSLHWKNNCRHESPFMLTKFPLRRFFSFSAFLSLKYIPFREGRTRRLRSPRKRRFSGGNSARRRSRFPSPSRFPNVSCLKSCSVDKI